MTAPASVSRQERRGARRSLGGGEPFVVELERFHGPLDLLLHLIRSQDIDIFDIPIARITAQFREALAAGIEDLELARAGEFLEMASTLVHIKAQMLLPRNEDPDWEEDPRAELVRRLLEYEFFQEVAQVLMNAEADRSRHFPKGYVPPRPEASQPAEDLELSLEEFVEGARGVPEPREARLEQTPSREVTVTEKIGLVRRLLGKAKRVIFDRLFKPWKDRFHAVASLLACLELARRQVIRIDQVEHFGDVWLFRGDRFEEEVEEGTAEEAARSGAAGPADGAGEEEGGA